MSARGSPELVRHFILVLGSQAIVFVAGLVKALIIPLILGIEDFGYWQIYVFYVAYVGVFSLGYNDGVYLKYGGYPINAMGISKAMMEKVVVAKSRSSNDTVICATRYGNVMASRGSVIPLFTNQIRAGQSITITDPSMTRFMMTLDDAVDLVLFAFKNGRRGEIFVQKAPAATIETLAKALIPSISSRVVFWEV